ncbi:hypothetical protein BV455_00549 [Parageobacillus caldoxylosilyticus]|nr:hypothetical protein BV455_00549 [Parageobacillus caldoxylosilyticus]
MLLALSLSGTGDHKELLQEKELLSLQAIFLRSFYNVRELGDQLIWVKQAYEH